MSAELLKLSYFPNDGRIWRVEWIYDVKYNPAVPSESLFVASIAPLTEDAQEKYESGIQDNIKQFYKAEYVDKNELTEIEVGVGQSALIDIGSLWKNGVLINSNVGIKETFDLVVDDAHVEYHPAFYQYDHNGTSIPALPYNQQIMDPKKGRVVNCAFVKYEDDPYHFIIPAQVLINFYLCSSTSLAHAVFDGTIISAASTEIYKPEKTSYSVQRSVFSIYLRMKMHDYDAWTLSRTYKTKEGYEAARLVHDSLMIQNVKGNKYLFPVTKFPFIGPTQLTLCYKPIFCKHTHTFRKLVYSIYHCTAPFPFNTIQVIRDATEADIKTDISEEKKKPFNSTNKNKNPSSTPLGSNQEPSNLSLNNNIDKPQNRYGFTEDKPIEKPLKEQCLYKSSTAKKLKEINTNEQGTGKGTWGPSRTSRASVNTKRAPLDSSFDTLVAAIDKLNEHEEVTASIRTSTEQTKVIPLIKPGKKRQWPYLDSKTGSRRAVIIADIEYKSKNFCLIDFKFRNNESYSRGIIYRTDYLTLSDDLIYRLLIRLAHARGRWLNISNLDSKVSKPVITKHSEPSIETFVKKMVDKLMNLVF